MKPADSSTCAGTAACFAKFLRASICAKSFVVIPLALGALFANPTYAQGTIRASAPPVEYTPFDVVLRMDNEQCFDSVFPIFSNVRYSEGTLSVVLTHLNSPLRPKGVTNTCRLERKFTVSGLPRGRQTIKIELTEAAPLVAPGLRVSATLTTTVEVAAISATTNLVDFWTGTFTPALGGGARGTHLTASRFSPWNVEWDWLELAGSDWDHTFKGFSFAAGDRLPDTLAQLYLVGYPDPYRGSFWTTDKAVAQRLAGEWANPLFEMPLAVGRLNSGACPIGMSPVYQTFHRQAVTHRWTQSRAAYAAMLANGYSGDGPVWCAPALRGE